MGSGFLAPGDGTAVLETGRAYEDQVWTFADSVFGVSVSSC